MAAYERNGNFDSHKDGSAACDPMLSKFVKPLLLNQRSIISKDSTATFKSERQQGSVSTVAS